MKKAGSLEKNIFTFKHIKRLYVIALVLFVFIFSSSNIFLFDEKPISAGYKNFIPSAPTGNTTGDINIEYEYKIYCLDVGSFWKFDWGDGSYSDWIEVIGSSNYTYQTHSWSSYDIYNVRVKFKSNFGSESQWSKNLKVTISPPTDIDGDGFDNDLELSYGSDPEDYNSQPLDTDSDNIADEDSPDGSYTGDTDDDNDGLSDLIELYLGSNPKNYDDVITLFLDDKIYYLLDTNSDSKGDFLYYKESGLKTKVLFEEGEALLDIDNDGSWDYCFKNGIVYDYVAPFPWLYLIISIICIVLLIIFLLFKFEVLYLYEEEYVVEE